MYVCSCLHMLLSVYTSGKRGHVQHVHTFMCVWVGPITAYSLGLPARSSWWLTAAISFLSEWVYNPCYNAVIIQYAYICLALTKHVQSWSKSSALFVYLISKNAKYGLVGIKLLFQALYSLRLMSSKLTRNSYNQSQSHTALKDKVNLMGKVSNILHFCHHQLKPIKFTKINNVSSSYYISSSITSITSLLTLEDTHVSK